MLSATRWVESVLKVTKEDFPQVSQYVSRAEELKALLASHNRLSFEEVRTSTDVLRGKGAWNSPAALLLLLEPRTEPVRAHSLCEQQSLIITCPNV